MKEQNIIPFSVRGVKRSKKKVAQIKKVETFLRRHSQYTNPYD
jgi:hypothetical protein